MSESTHYHSLSLTTPTTTAKAAHKAYNKEGKTEEKRVK